MWILEDQIKLNSDFVGGAQKNDKNPEIVFSTHVHDFLKFR